MPRPPCDEASPPSLPTSGAAAADVPGDAPPDAPGQKRAANKIGTAHAPFLLPEDPGPAITGEHQPRQAPDGPGDPHEHVRDDRSMGRHRCEPISLSTAEQAPPAFRDAFTAPLALDGRMTDWRLLGAVPKPPAYDEAAHGPLAGSALERLREIGDPQYEALQYMENLWLYRMSTEGWASVRDTSDPLIWADILGRAGADERSMQALFLLAQQGPAGRVEANRFIWQHLKPRDPAKKGSGKGPGGYCNAAQVFQVSVRNARFDIDRLPDDHKDWQAWTPGTSLNGRWELRPEFAPRGMPSSTP